MKERAGGSSLPGPPKVNREEEEVVTRFRDTFQQREDVGFSWEV